MPRLVDVVVVEWCLWRLEYVMRQEMGAPESFRLQLRKSCDAETRTIVIQRRMARSIALGGIVIVI